MKAITKSGIFFEKWSSISTAVHWQLQEKQLCQLSVCFSVLLHTYTASLHFFFLGKVHLRIRCNPSLNRDKHWHPNTAGQCQEQFCLLVHDCFPASGPRNQPQAPHKGVSLEATLHTEVPEEALQRPHHLDAEDTRRAGSTIGPREARAVGLLGQWVLQFFICIPTWLSHLFIITLEQWLIAALVHTGAGWILGCRWEMPRKPRAPRRPACSASHSSTTRALWGV